MIRSLFFLVSLERNFRQRAWANLLFIYSKQKNNLNVQTYVSQNEQLTCLTHLPPQLKETARVQTENQKISCKTIPSIIEKIIHL
jgi:hypothetical protein